MGPFSPLTTVWLVRAVFVFGVVGLLAGCPRHGIVDDGTSVSFGPANRGKLVNPARIPRRGVGFWSPPRWHNRGLRFGTDEMIDLITYAGRRMVDQAPRGVIGIADISRRRGGPSAWHRSHQTGRDVDLLFFATGADGKPVQMRSMPRFRDDGTAIINAADPDQQPLVFDVARNWRLIKILIQNPIAQVQYVFVSNGLKQLLIDHALVNREPTELVLQASHLLRQPTRSLPHDDHFHVRIYCADHDRALGCIDRGMLRWNKKGYKYGLTPTPPETTALQVATSIPVPAAMSWVPVLLTY